MKETGVLPLQKYREVWCRINKKILTTLSSFVMIYDDEDAK